MLGSVHYQEGPSREKVSEVCNDGFVNLQVNFHVVRRRLSLGYVRS